MPKRKTPSDEDEAQSAKFLESARELEAAGDLSPTGEALERAFGKMVPARKRGPSKKD